MVYEESDDIELLPPPPVRQLAWVKTGTLKPPSPPAPKEPPVRIATGSLALSTAVDPRSFIIAGNRNYFVPPGDGVKTHHSSQRHTFADSDFIAWQLNTDADGQPIRRSGYRHQPLRDGSPWASSDVITDAPAMPEKFGGWFVDTAGGKATDKTFLAFRVENGRAYRFTLSRSIEAVGVITADTVITAYVCSCVATKSYPQDRLMSIAYQSAVELHVPNFGSKYSPIQQEGINFASIEFVPTLQRTTYSKDAVALVFSSDTGMFPRLEWSIQDLGLASALDPRQRNFELTWIPATIVG